MSEKVYTADSETADSAGKAEKKAVNAAETECFCNNFTCPRGHAI